MYAAFREGRGTRDLCGPSGLTTEQFVESVAADLSKRMESGEVATPFVPPPEKEQAPSRKLRKAYESVDEDAMKKFFDKYDTDTNGAISFAEFAAMTVELGIA